MKKGLLFILISVITISTCLATEKIQVTVSKDGTKNSYKLKKQIKEIAKKAAITKYIERINSSVPHDILRKATNEYNKFVRDIYEESSEWQDLGGNNFGQLTVTYTAVLKDQDLNQYLEQLGLTVQGKAEIVILEEPPSLAQIKLGEAVDNSKFFVDNYTQFQRRIRDAIIKNTDKYGLKVILLSDKDEYAEYKTKDSTLLGVFFDPEHKKFAIDNDLLNEIKSNYPDTIVLYFRLDSLIYDPANKMLKVTVAFNLKKLDTNVTKSVGSKSYSSYLKSTQPEMIIDTFGACAENAVQLLMNEAGPKLNHIIMMMNNAPKSTGPIILSLNGNVFDAKVRKRVLYTIKKKLISKGLTDNSKIKVRNTNLLATIIGKDNAEDFCYEDFLPILEDMNLEVPDDKISFNGNKIIIKP